MMGCGCGIGQTGHGFGTEVLAVSGLATLMYTVDAGTAHRGVTSDGIREI
jgi:hypothetical protein